MSLVVTVNGVDKTLNWWQPRGDSGDFRFARVPSGRGPATCVFYDLTAAYAPSIGQAFAFADGGTTVFGGEIIALDQSTLDESITLGISTVATIVDQQALAGRVFHSATYASTTVGAILAALVAGPLAVFGVTVDGGQAAGPAVASLTFEGVTVEAILNELQTLTGWIWRISPTKVLRMIEPGSVATGLTLGDTQGSVEGKVGRKTSRADSYANRVIVGYGAEGLTVQAQDASAVTSPWEVRYKSDVMTELEAQALADGYLRKALAAPQQLTVTHRAGLAWPGETVTLAFTSLGLAGTYMVLDVDAFTCEDGLFSYTFTLVSGTELTGDWRDYFRTMAARGAIAAGSVTAVLQTIGIKPTYFLGGSGVELVQGATWVAASPMRVGLDSVARGSTAATVTVRVRNLDGGTVRVRLQNLTDGTTAGTGTIKTSVAWTDDSFAVTLAAGLKTYELQVLPGATGQDCAAIGYLE